MTTKQQFEHRVIDNNIGYFKFYEKATEKDYQDAFGSYVKMISNANITKLLVVNDKKGKWDSVIEGVWVQTAKLAEEHGIKKWGVVTPDSAIREMTLNRVVKKGNFSNNPNYQFFLSRNEDEVLTWIKA